MSLGFSAIALPALLATENPNKLDYNQASWVGKFLPIITYNFNINNNNTST